MAIITTISDVQARLTAESRASRAGYEPCQAKLAELWLNKVVLANSFCWIPC